MTSYKILAFGNQWDLTRPLSSRHIVTRLANGGKVLWVNPLPLVLPSLKGVVANKGLQNRILAKLKIHTNPLTKYENVRVLSPFYIPIYRKKIFFLINALLLREQVRLAVRAVLGKEYLVYATSTYAVLDALDIVKGKKLIFHYADLISALRALPEEKRPEFRQKDIRINESSDLVLCSSRTIMKSLETLVPSNSKLRYFPHGVKWDLFNSARKHPKTINEMEDIPKPIIGYFGSLSDANDKEAIRFCADKRPDWNFVFIGEVKGDYAILKGCPNIHFLEKKRHEDIPHYGRYFDVGLLNWRPHDWIKNCYPLKSLEYLALGLPIVSTPIEEIRENFSDFVFFAHSPEDYLQGIEKCINEDSTEKQKARISRVKNETWDSRIRVLRKWIQEL